MFLPTLSWNKSLRFLKFLREKNFWDQFCFSSQKWHYPQAWKPIALRMCQENPISLLTPSKCSECFAFLFSHQQPWPLTHSFILVVQQLRSHMLPWTLMDVHEEILLEVVKLQMVGENRLYFRKWKPHRRLATGNVSY